MGSDSLEREGNFAVVIVSKIAVVCIGVFVDPPLALKLA